MSIGKSSSRPASISNINTYLEKFEKNEKFCEGPASDKPGPILLIVAATAVKLVTRSYSSKETRNSEPQKIMRNVMKYTLMERTTSCSTGFLSK